MFRLDHDQRSSNPRPARMPLISRVTVIPDIKMTCQLWLTGSHEQLIRCTLTTHSKSALTVVSVKCLPLIVGSHPPPPPAKPSPSCFADHKPTWPDPRPSQNLS